MTRGRDARALLAALLCVVALLAGPGAAAAGARAPASSTTALPASSHDTETLPVEIVVTGMTPQVLRPGDDLVITATLHNTGDTVVAEPRLLLWLNRNAFFSRSALDEWRTADPRLRVGAAIADLDLPGPLPPGASAEVTMTVPADAIGLRTASTSWGPRGVALEVVDVADRTRVGQGVVRTFVLWYPAEEVTATRLSVLVPLTGPAVDPHDASWVPELEELTDEGGRLADVLTATEDARDVTWVVDPWLVDVARPSAPPSTGDLGGDAEAGPRDAAGPPEEPGDAPGPTGSDSDSGTPADAPATPDAAVRPAVVLPDAGAVARAWVERLVAATTDRDVQLLPYLDQDLAALAHADAGEQLDRALERGRDVVVATGLPDGATAAIAWPADDLPDLATAAFARRHGADAVLVGPGELPAPSVLRYTPDGRTTAGTAGGETTVLVPDERLSSALRTGAVPTGPAEGAGGTGGGADGDGTGGAGRGDGSGLPGDRQHTPVTAAQDLLAELAVITRERPDDSRHLLMTVPRDWAPDVDVAQAQLAALEAVPWVRLTPVSALVGAPDTGVDRGSLPRRSTDPAEVDGATLALVESTVRTRTGLAQMAAEPERLLGDEELEILAPASVAWRDDVTGRSRLVDRSQAATQALRDAVGVLPGSALNLISTSAGLPVRLANGLDQPVTVEVALRPGDSRLRADDTVTVTIPAAGEEEVQIPVHAIQSADVAVAVEVRTPDGTLVDDDTVLEVRVRADWEGIGTGVLGGLLALGLVFGVVRTIRRGRTGRRAAPQADSGPDAMSPEARDELLRGGTVVVPGATAGRTSPPGHPPDRTAGHDDQMSGRGPGSGGAP